MNDKFIKNVTSLWGKEGKKWLNDIPKIITEFEKKWSIKVGAPFNLSHNYVASAICEDETEVVIKIGFPKDKEFISELKTLPLFNSKGMVKQLKRDKNQAVMLLESIKPGIPIATLDDDKATEVMAKVMQNFWVPAPSSNNNIVQVFEWSKGFQRLRAKFAGSAGPLPENLVSKAEEVYMELLRSNDPQYLLHGDLHQDNVISATREPWLAIDPKGMIGPKERETAPMLMNPKGFILKSKNPKELLKRRITILSDFLGLEKEKITAWGFTQTVLSVIWTLEDHNRVDEERLAIAKILNSISTAYEMKSVHILAH